MLYVDGLVTALPSANITAYHRLVDAVVPLMRSYGAINVVHCNDRMSGEGESAYVREFDDSVVVFSWIIWPSREVRDFGMERMLADPRFDDVMNPVALEGERVDLDVSLLPRLH